ncbi:MAG: hypothetical protein ACKO0Z_01490 [Betaproteobacteria bacterium]
MQGDRGASVIINALSYYLVRRMRNWARAGAGVGIGTLKAIDYGAEYGNGYRESRVPLMLGEAHDTELALSSIAMRYQQVIRRFWEREGMSLRWHAAQRGIHHDTLKVWLITGHEHLQDEVSRREKIATEVARENRRMMG